MLLTSQRAISKHKVEKDFSPEQQRSAIIIHAKHISWYRLTSAETFSILATSHAFTSFNNLVISTYLFGKTSVSCRTHPFSQKTDLEGESSVRVILVGMLKDDYEIGLAQ